MFLHAFFENIVSRSVALDSVKNESARTKKTTGVGAKLPPTQPV